MNTTLPPRPCASICLPAARAISHDWVTLTSITSMKVSGAWSTILDTLLMPDAITRISTPPNRLTAASTIFSQLAAEFGRRFAASVLAPSPSHSAATVLSASAPPAASTRLQPAPASTLAASAPNAPEAPVTIAILPRTSNRESGFLRKSSDMTDSRDRDEPLDPSWPGLSRPSTSFLNSPTRKTWLPAQASLRSLRKLGCERGHDGVCGAASASFHRRDRDCDRADIVAAVDDLARLVRADDAGVVLLQHGLLAADDHRQFSLEHDIDLFRWRRVGTRTAARQKMRDA